MNILHARHVLAFLDKDYLYANVGKNTFATILKTIIQKEMRKEFSK